MKTGLIFIFNCLLFNVPQISQGATRIDPLVDTNVGLIRGLKATDGDYSMFLGIPYAKVDEGNPFGPSQPFGNFHDTYEAYDDTAICPQIEQFNNTIVGTLDCLHLNIYVPDSANSKNPLPVLVWIYGGSFMKGFAGRYIYGPKYLVRHDIILVTINYRVGAYGFLCLDDPQVPGNQGLKDQLLALRWIKYNIASFGGNTNKITLFGESAGGRSVDYHLASSQEKLFNSVILQSGTSLLNIMVTEPDSTPTLNLAEKLGYKTDDVKEALEFLADISPNLVVAAAVDKDTYLPCVEKDFEGVEKFIGDYTMNKVMRKAKNMAIMIGQNSDEKLADHVNGNAEYFKNLNIFHNSLSKSFNFDSVELTEAVGAFKRFYIGDNEISELIKFNIIDFDSDFRYNHPNQRSIQKYIESGADKVFYYVFSYNGERNFVKERLNLTEGGAAHADEIGYLFDISYMRDEPSADDKLVIDRMTTLWTNFVKYGNPTPEETDLLPVKWSPVTEDYLYYYNIDRNISLENRPNNERMAFWDLFYKYNYQLQKGYQNNDD